jgi:coatomer protein complex subunit epsilon
MTTEHPTHPMVVNVANKAAAFDELASKFVVPPPA